MIAPAVASATLHCAPQQPNRRSTAGTATTAEPAADSGAGRGPSPLPRAARPTRITVDLAAELHSFLRGYAQARDVAAADVIRELIRQVRADPDLSARVTAELARRREALAEAMRAARE